MNDSYDIKSYDIYDKGYRTGAQTYIFLGPIWIEEACFFQIDASDSKQPVYSYNGVKFDRLLQGRYLVTGTIGINYVEANYLLNIINTSLEKSALKDTLKDLIVNRKSIFLERLRNSESFQKMAEANGLGDINSIENYVDRICAEAELASGGSSLDPTSFELTFVHGELNNTSQAIEIYVGAQINGTGKRNANDDNITMEMYNWTAQGMKEKELVRAEEVPDYAFSKSNLLQMTREITEKLMDAVMTDPEVDVYSTNSRTKLMNNAARLGVGGTLHPKTRMFGRSASFIEMVYAFELPRDFINCTDEDNPGKEKQILSDTALVIKSKAKAATAYRNETNSGIHLKPPRQESRTDCFDNSFGRIVSIDREYTSSKIRAISPIGAQPLYDRLGGSIALPNYKRNTFNIGSFIPPKIIDKTSAGSTNWLEEKDIESITYGTLWCCLTGYRGTGNAQGKGSNDEDTGAYLDEIAQPLYTFAYVKQVSSTFESGSDPELKISVPIYIDYIHLDETAPGGLSKCAQEPLIEIESVRNVTFTLDKTSGAVKTIAVDTSEDGDETSANYDKIFPESLITAKHMVVNTGATVVTSSTTLTNIEDWSPKFLRTTLTNNSPKLATDFHKCLYFVPFIFQEVGDEGAYISEKEGPGALRDLAYFLNRYSGGDSSCAKVNFDYDWKTSDVSGVLTVGGKITADGVFFLTPSDSSTCNKNFHVIWLMAVIPVERGKKDSNANTVDITHDISTPGGRYAEFYNITRCDHLYHIRSMYQSYNPGDSISQAIKKSMVDLWDSLMNCFWDINHESYESRYAMPVRQTLRRICGFIEGYSIRISVREIVNQILKCEFDSDEVKQYVGKNVQTVNLEMAYSIATNDTNGSNKKSLKDEIASVIRNEISVHIEKKGANLVGDISKDEIVIEVPIPVPPANLIEYGLRDEGYDVLMETRNKNMEFRNDGTTATDSETSETLRFGAYDAII